MSDPTTAAVPARGSRPWWAGTLPVPTWRTAALLGVAAVLSGVGPAGIGVLLPVGVVALAVAVDAALAPAPWHVPVARDLPRVVPLDGAGEVRWTVVNPTSRPLAVGLADELAPSLGASRRRVAMQLPPRGRGRADAQLGPQRRGTFRPTTVTVRVRGPLGLATRQADRALPGHLEVHPRFRSRAEAALRIRRGRILEQGRRAVRGAGTGTEFEALRDYVQGDEFRHIDWAATARIGHPVVRTYRVERDQTVLVLLDRGRLVAGSVEGVPRLDHSMDATLALATVALALGDRVGLIAYGSEVDRILAPRRDGDQLRRLSRELHTLEPELAASDHDAAARTVLTRLHRRALVVLVTDLAPEAAEDTLLPAVPALLRYHRVVVASVRDPALTDRLRGEVRDVSAAYAAAGAATVEAGRARVTARLRAMGAGVVDLPPRAFAAGVADSYLDVKAGGAW